MKREPLYPNYAGLSANSARTSRNQDIDPNFQDFDQLLAEVLQHQTIIVGLAAGGNALLIENNLSDLDDAAAARTNLGLGTMSVEDAADYTPTAGFGTMAFEAAADYYTAAEADAEFLTEAEADALYEPLGGGGGGASLTVDKINDNAGTLPPGHVVYVKSNGHVDSARADSATTTEAFGLAAEAILTTATGPIQTAGTLTLSTAEWDAITGQSGGLTPGAYYYVSPTSSGSLTTTAPTTAGQFVVPVGLAHSTTEMEIRPERAILL